MSGLILPAGVEPPEPEAVRPVELTEEKWPIAVHIQLPGSQVRSTVVVPCGDPDQAVAEAWRSFISRAIAYERLDAIQAIEWKKQQDEANGFRDTTP